MTKMQEQFFVLIQGLINLELAWRVCHGSAYPPEPWMAQKGGFDKGRRSVNLAWMLEKHQN